MPRLLFVHDVIGDLGGAEAYVRQVAEGLSGRGWEVALLHGPGTGTGEERFHTVFPHRFPWATAWPAALAAAQTWRPDVVFVHKLAHLPLLRELVDSDLPLVRYIHDHHLWCQRGYRYFPWNRQICTRTAGLGCALTCLVLRDRQGFLPLRLAWPGKKLDELALAKRFRRHVTVTGYMRDELVQHGLDRERIAILPPAPKPAPADWAPTYAAPLLVCTGQLVRGKGVDVLLRALPRLRTPGWRCVIIGDGAQRPHCERLARRLGLAERVQFTGWVAQDDLRRWWRDARVGVIPSVWPEPIATVGLEYLHHALPVVAFNVGGMGDWLRDGDNGFSVPAWDLATLAERLDRLLGDADLARRFGATGQAQARATLDREGHLDALSTLLHAEAGD